MPTCQCISAEEAVKIYHEEQTTVFDARDLPSYRQGAIEGAVFLSGDRIPLWAEKLDEKEPILIYCFLGNTSKSLGEQFAALQFERVYSVEGGYRPLAKLLSSNTC